MKDDEKDRPSPPIESTSGEAVRTTSFPDEGIDDMMQSLASAPVQPVDLLLPGTVIDGKVEILRDLGKGGMGKVYLGRDLRLGRKVAVKLIRGDLAARPGMRERFLKEARVTANLSHPNIVEIHDYGQHEGQPYFVLEYLLGEPLSERRTGRPAAPGPVLEVLVPVAQALRCGHEHVPRIIHRDMKPENVFLCEDGRVKVLDFGLSGLVAPGSTVPAKAAALSAFEAAPDGTKTTAGTLGYMAPEQWRGEEQDPRVDVWAVGVILYELLNGRRPYADLEGSEKALKDAVRSDDPVPGIRDSVPGLNVEVAGIVDRCLAKDPGVRFRNAGELLDALERAAAQIGYRGEARGDPYRGLDAFAEEDAGWFFGRESETLSLLRKLDDNPLVALAGASGAGKTSLVRAGLGRQLRERGTRWEILELRPGPSPLRMLARRMAELTGEEEQDLRDRLWDEPGRLGVTLRATGRKRNAKVLLFVDQGEEVFTLGADGEERRRFLDALLGAADDVHGPVRVIVATRSDYVVHFGEHREFLRAMESGMVILGPLGPEGFDEALRRPAEIKGYGIEPAVVEDVVETLRDRAGGLPLLQLVGQKLWEARDRDRRLLTHGVYDEIGRARGALSRHADSVLAGLGKERRAVAREILCRLVTPERTRRAEPMTALLGFADPDTAQEVLGILVSRRLLVTHHSEDDAVVELVHESLIEGWGTLRGWLDEDRELAVALELVRNVMKADAQLRGRPLKQVAAVYEDDPDRFTENEKAFVARSISRERRGFRLRLGAAVMIPSLVALAALLAVVNIEAAREDALEAGDEAFRAKEIAEQRSAEIKRQKESVSRALEETNESRQAEKQAWTETQGALFEAEAARDVSDKSLRTARRHLSGAYVFHARELAQKGEWHKARTAAHYSMLHHPSDAARDLLKQASGRPRRVWTAPNGANVRDFRFMPDGERLVAATSRGLMMWSLRSGRVVWRNPSALVRSVDVTPDGDTIITDGIGPNGILAWGADSGRRIRDIECGPDAEIGKVVVSPDGKLVATIPTAGDEVRLWRLSDCIQTHRLEHPSVEWIGFGRGGRILASRGNPGDVIVWDARSGEKLRSYEQMAGAAISSDGRLIFLGLEDETVRVEDLDTGGPLQTFHSEQGVICPKAVSPAGDQLASMGWDGAVAVWDRKDGNGRSRTLGRFELWSVRAPMAYSPRGDLLAWVDWNGTLHLWDLERSTSIARAGGLANTTYEVTFSPTGETFASAGKDGAIHVTETTTAKEIVRLPGHPGGADTVRFSPDGATLASGGADGLIRLWDAPGWAPAGSLTGHREGVESISWSPDGARLASGGEDGFLRVWDVGGRKEIQAVPVNEASVSVVEFSPNGRWLASSGGDDEIFVWDTASWKQVAALEEPGGGVTDLAFSPDGILLAMAVRDGTVRLIDSYGEEEAVLGGFLPTTWGHPDRITSVTFSPDGRRLVAGSEAGRVGIWELRWCQPYAVCAGELDGVPVLSFLESDGGEVGDVEISPDGRLLLVAGKGPTSLWELGRPFGEIARVTHENAVDAVDLAPGGGLVASGSWDRMVRFWDPATGRRVDELSVGDCSVRSLAFSHDGDRLALLCSDNAVELWDVPGRTRLARWLQDDVGGLCLWEGGRLLAFSPDDRLLASSTRDRTPSVRIWDLDTLTEKRRLLGHGDALESVAFSPDGRFLASVSHDSSLRLWDAKTWEQIEVFTLDHELYAVAFDPSGERVAVGGKREWITLLNWRDDGEVRYVRRCAEQEFMPTGFLEFSPDGSLLASGSCTGAGVTFYDTTTGDVRGDIAVWDPHGVSNAAFSPNGRYLVTAGGFELTARAWDLSVVLGVYDGAAEARATAEYYEGLAMDGFAFSRETYGHLIPLAPGVFDHQGDLECMIRPHWMEHSEENLRCRRALVP